MLLPGYRLITVIEVSALYLLLDIIIFHIYEYIVIFTSKRNKELADFSEYWNTEKYRYHRYMTFETNTRPFPFTNMARYGKFEK